MTANTKQSNNSIQAKQNTIINKKNIICRWVRTQQKMRIAEKSINVVSVIRIIIFWRKHYAKH